jgi:hypothetical protein
MLALLRDRGQFVSATRLEGEAFEEKVTGCKKGGECYSARGSRAVKAGRFHCIPFRLEPFPALL